MTQEQPYRGRPGHGVIQAVDALLRRSHGVYEFSQDPDCILRVSRVRSRWDLTLADGTHIVPGEPLVVIHWWNDQMPPMGEEGADLTWAREFLRRLPLSLRGVAEHMRTTPALGGVRAICGEATFLSTDNMSAGRVLLPRLGFEIHPSIRRGAWGRFRTFWENVYSWLLMWAFNPGSIRGRRPSDLQRYFIWMTRGTLESKYGSRDTGRGTSGKGQSLGQREGAGPGAAPGGPDPTGSG